MMHQIEHFCNYFADYQDAYVLIGGAACTAWYAEQEPSFRPTADLDIVLIIEDTLPHFTEAFKRYVQQCGYKACVVARVGNDMPPKKILYRYDEPTDPAAPKQLELLSRHNENLSLVPGQYAEPLKVEKHYLGLSHILLDDDYYKLIRKHISHDQGIPRPTIPVLIVLKIKAYLNLSRQRKQEQQHGSDGSTKNIRKHRNDVFFLLFDINPEQDALTLPDSIREDVNSFLMEFAPSSPEWPGIFDHLKSRRGKAVLDGLSPEMLLDQLRELFGL